MSDSEYKDASAYWIKKIQTFILYIRVGYGNFGNETVDRNQTMHDGKFLMTFVFAENDMKQFDQNT